MWRLLATLMILAAISASVAEERALPRIGLGGNAAGGPSSSVDGLLAQHRTSTDDATGLYNGSTPAVIFNPNGNIKYYPLPGYLSGDWQRAGFYTYQQSKYDVTKGEYAQNFDFKVTTGQAQNWHASANYIPNEYIHGYASGSDTLYQMTGGSPCKSAASGSGPTWITGSKSDNTCTWTAVNPGQANSGISDGKVGLSIGMVASGTPGHMWGAAFDLVNNAPLYYGNFQVGLEIDNTVGNRQDCVPAKCNSNSLYLTGIQAGIGTAEIAINKSPAAVNNWSANTAYGPWALISSSGNVYENTNDFGCISGIYTPIGTSIGINDGTCTWNYIRSGSYAWGDHYYILMAGANGVWNAAIADSTGAADSYLDTGTHRDATINTTNATTSYFWKGAQGQALAFNGTNDTIVGQLYAGSNVISVYQRGALVTNFLNPASAANYLQLSGSTAGNGPTITPQGLDKNINLNMTPKGSGVVRIVSGGVQITPVAHGSLPTCNSTTAGTVAAVNDGVPRPSYHATASGGGSAIWVVSCSYDGTTYNWVY